MSARSGTTSTNRSSSRTATSSNPAHRKPGGSRARRTSSLELPITSCEHFGGRSLLVPLRQSPLVRGSIVWIVTERFSSSGPSTGTVDASPSGYRDHQAAHQPHNASGPPHHACAEHRAGDRHAGEDCRRFPCACVARPSSSAPAHEVAGRTATGRFSQLQPEPSSSSKASISKRTPVPT